jgi:hypothetical protein
MTFFPPEITRYTREGGGALSLVGIPTDKGKLWGQIQWWLSYLGPGLLSISFVLQLVALLGAQSSGEAANTRRPQEDRRWSRRVQFWCRRWGALFVAVLALLLAAWTAYSDREHKILSVRPHLSISWFYDEADPKAPKRGWRLNNQGLGPAVIRVFEVYVDEKPQTAWAAFAAALELTDPNNTRHFITNLYSDQIVPSSQSLMLFAVSDAAARETITRQVARVRMALCYCSLYDECWRVSSVRDPVYLRAHTAVGRCDLPSRGQVTWLGNSLR